jgi:hypothetical protein
MKKTIILLFTTLLVTIAQSTPYEIRKKIICEETKILQEEMRKGFGEYPVWGGQSENTNFVLLLNKDTTTWSLIEFDNDTSCILGHGEGFRILDLIKRGNWQQSTKN